MVYLKALRIVTNKINIANIYVIIFVLSILDNKTLTRHKPCQGKGGFIRIASNSMKKPLKSLKKTSKGKRGV